MLGCFDVGFANMGWVIFDKKKPVSAGVIKTEKSQKKGTRVADDHSYRSCIIAKELNSLIVGHKLKGIIGELPSGGAQSAKAMAFMSSAISVISSVGTIHDLPMEWCTPNDVKKAVCGKRNASKDEIMETISKIYRFNIVKQKRSTSFVTDFGTFIKGEFEHIADAFGVYLALQNDNLVKLFG